MIKKIVLLLLFILLSTLTSKAQAQVENVTVISDQSPYLIIGDALVNRIGLIGDTFFIGDTIEILNPINGDVFAIGAKVKIDAPIDGDLRVIAQNLEIRSQINGSVAMLVENAYIASTGEIEQDVYGISTRLIHEGRIGENLNLRYAPGSDINITGKILGNFWYSETRPNISETAYIQGQIEKITLDDSIKKENRSADILRQIIHSLSVILVGLVIYKLKPKVIDDAVDQMDRLYLKRFGYGIVALLMIPFLIFILTVSVIGIPLALIIAGILAFLLYMTSFFAGAWLGMKIFSESKIKILHLILGIFLYDVITLLPIIGGITTLFVFTILLGIIANNLFIKKNLSNEKK